MHIMQLLTDDLVIFSLLEKAQQVSFDPAKPAALDFHTEDHVALFLFNPAGPLKGCRLYLLDQRSADEELESVLLPELLALPEEEGYAVLKNELISRRNSSRLFFDAH